MAKVVVDWQNNFIDVVFWNKCDFDHVFNACCISFGELVFNKFAFMETKMGYCECVYVREKEICCIFECDCEIVRERANAKPYMYRCVFRDNNFDGMFMWATE